MMTRMSDRINHERFDDGPGDNPTWGAPHIQSELALLGHDLAEMDDRVRLHDQQRRPPVGPETHQPCPEHAVPRTQFRTLDGLTHDGELLPQR